MAEIVNLNKARKQRVRQAGDKTASQNRVKFGLIKQVRDAAHREKAKQIRELDGARLEPEPDRDV